MNDFIKQEELCFLNCVCSVITHGLPPESAIRATGRAFCHAWVCAEKTPNCNVKAEDFLQFICEIYREIREFYESGQNKSNECETNCCSKPKMAPKKASKKKKA